jgi:hypothetical protein
VASQPAHKVTSLTASQADDMLYPMARCCYAYDAATWRIGMARSVVFFCKARVECGQGCMLQVTHTALLLILGLCGI